MLRRLSLKAIILILVSLSCLATAQNGPTVSNSERKISSRIAPSYPDLAKRMHMHGIVRIEAVVRPNGSVKSTRVLGGNPVLVDAALTAVEKWKFEPGQNETTEVLQVAFEAQ